MGITQQIGASSIIKPGVIDNTAARPASPYEGQVIFQKDTDQLLVWNGTAWVIPNSPAQNPQGLELISSTTVGTAVSTVTVSSAFSTTYDAYKILVSGITSSVAGDLRITLGSTVTGYYGSYTYVYYVNGASAVYGQNNSANFYIGGVSSNDDQNVSLEILNPFTAKRTSLNGLAYGNAYSFFYSGMVANTTSYTAFTIANASGTLTGGTITVYGYRK